MHLLEMAKTQWNHSFVAQSPTNEQEKESEKQIVFQLLGLARRVLTVLGTEGDPEGGPFKDISILEDIARHV